MPAKNQQKTFFIFLHIVFVQHILKVGGAKSYMNNAPTIVPVTIKLELVFPLGLIH